MPPTPDDCIPQIQACRLRVCRLDADGAPTVAAGSSYVSDAFAKVTLTPVYETGAEIKEPNACGSTFINYLSPDSLTRWDIEIDLLTPDPYLHDVLLSSGALLSPVGGGVGFGFPEIGTIPEDAVSVELWAKRIESGALSQSFPYAHWAVPFVKNLKTGVKEFANTAQHSAITGQCYQNANWLDGPFNDFNAESDRCAQWIPTLTLPDVACGPTAVAAS